MNSRFSPPVSPTISTTPWMSEAAKAALNHLLDSSQEYLEYGAGGSTRFAASKNIRRLLSVESDPRFMSAVDRHIRDDAPQLDWRPILVSIGPTGPLGYPKTLRVKHRWARYALSPWAQDINPDLILVDGRFRVACALAAACYASPGTRVFVDDYALRPWYWRIANYLKPLYKAGRAQVFEVSDQRSDQLRTALKRACRDPR